LSREANLSPKFEVHGARQSQNLHASVLDLPQVIFELRQRLYLIQDGRVAAIVVSMLAVTKAIRNIAINRVTDEQAENNWSMCVLSAGAADANTVARAALNVQYVLRHDYDLTTD
jgi:hypothetical protein